MPTLDQLLDQLKILPTAPRILPRLLQLLNNSDAETADVVELVRYDPSLTARILFVCNSAYFRGAEPADDLHEAVARLGFTELFKIGRAHV